MSKKLNSKFLFSLLLMAILAVGFNACQQNEEVTPQDQKIEQTVFQQYLADHTQNIPASDLGEGKYKVVGEQGTTIEIDNALVDATGNRVRGAVDIVLIEIYSVPDMILNRKQTLADYNGQPEILESGGEIFVKVYQNGEELFADGNGTMNIYLPTENTGGPRDNMELYYGEETGDQVIWKPTGEKVRVVNNESRDGGEYLVMIQNILGWINVDIIWGASGEPVECLEVKIECPETCDPTGANTVVTIYVSGLNSAFELVFDPGTGTYKLCGGPEGPIPLGGIQVTFIVVIDCGNGTVQAAIVTTTVTPGYHLETITCGQLNNMSPEELQDALQSLVQ